MSLKIHTSGMVYIKSHYGAFMSADNNGRITMQNHLGDWEKFDLELSNKTDARIKTFHGTYLCILGDSTIAQCKGDEIDENIISTLILSRNQFNPDLSTLSTVGGIFVNGLKDGTWTVGKSSHDQWAQLEIANCPITPRGPSFEFKNMRVSIQAWDGAYVSALGNGKIVHSKDCNEKEWFTAEYKEGKVRFKTYYGTYVCAMNDDSMCQQKQGDRWEFFDVSKTKEGKFTFQTIYESYVSSLKNGTIAQVKQHGNQEEFTIALVKRSPVVHFKTDAMVAIATSHGTFIGATKEGTPTQDKHIHDGSYFKITNSKDIWYFESTHTTMLSTVQDSDKIDLVLNQMTPLQAFRILIVGERTFAIQALNGSYLSASKDGTFSFSTQFTEWERFEFYP